MKKVSVQIKLVFGMIIMIWVIYFVDQITPMYDFTQFGIMPRTQNGLIGIIFAPFLHISLNHLIQNTIPLFTLSLILAISYPKRAILSWILTSLTTGILVWLFARSAIHVGASGVIFGLLGFLVVYGIFRRSIGSVVLSVVVAAIYGAYLYGIIPADQRVSWESHLFGLIAGALWGYILGKTDRKKMLLQKAGAVPKEDSADKEQQ